MNAYIEKIEQEIKQLPTEYLPALFDIVHIFRESISLKTTTESFQQGFKDALNGETQPIETLWDDIENKHQAF
ncbi:MAG: hypothetical protein ACXWVX_07910 [Sulfuricurvum sp.]